MYHDILKKLALASSFQRKEDWGCFAVNKELNQEQKALGIHLNCKNSRHKVFYNASL
jgi:hypothetical protein